MVAVDLGPEGPIELPGVVVAVDNGIGFAVRFSPLEPGVAAQLERFLASAGASQVAAGIGALGTA